MSSRPRPRPPHQLLPGLVVPPPRPKVPSSIPAFKAALLEFPGPPQAEVGPRTTHMAVVASHMDIVGTRGQADSIVVGRAVVY